MIVARNLQECLAEYPRIMLEAIAEGWGISLTDEQVPEIVERLVVEMTNGEAVRMVLGRLNDLEREALAYVIHIGQVKAHVLARKCGHIRRLGPGRLEWEPAWHSPASATERLWFLGLICREYGVDEEYHGEMFFIPPEILTVLPPMPSPVPIFQLEPVAPPRTVRDDQDALAHDVFLVLSYLRNHDVRAKKGVLAQHELVNLRPRLRHGTPQRLRFLHHICEQASLIRREAGTWQPTGQAAAWLKEAPLARRQVLYRTWLEDVNWNDLCLMPAVSCEDTGWRNNPILARKSLAHYLHRCPLDVWVSVDSFVESIHEVEPDFLRPDGDYDSWYIRDVQTGQYLMGYRNWDKVEGTLIRYLLGRPLLWLGLLAIGYAQEGEKPDSFRLTEGGAGILELREMETSKVKGVRDEESVLCRIVVQPNFQVVVPHEASWYDCFLLERFARWLDEEQGTAHYVIDTASIRASLQKGITVRQIQAFLLRVTGGQVPPQVLRTLRSWARGG